MLNLGFVQMTLPAKWTARYDSNSSQISLHYIDGLAHALLTLYSAGTENFEVNFEEFYEELANYYRRNGLYFDDLSEEFDSEMLVELRTPICGSSLQHIFVRLTHNVIVRMNLREYRPETEEAARIMMSSLQPGEVMNTTPAFKPLEIQIENLDWDRAGQIAVYNGVD